MSSVSRAPSPKYTARPSMSHVGAFSMFASTLPWSWCVPSWASTLNVVDVMPNVPWYAWISPVLGR